jgi:hypothetical protein
MNARQTIQESEEADFLANCHSEWHKGSEKEDAKAQYEQDKEDAWKEFSDEAWEQHEREFWETFGEDRCRELTIECGQVEDSWRLFKNLARNKYINEARPKWEQDHRPAWDSDFDERNLDAWMQRAFDSFVESQRNREASTEEANCRNDEILAIELFESYPEADLYEFEPPSPEESLHQYVSRERRQIRESFFHDTLFSFLLNELSGVDRETAIDRLKAAINDLTAVLARVSLQSR